MSQLLGGRRSFGADDVGLDRATARLCWHHCRRPVPSQVLLVGPRLRFEASDRHDAAIVWGLGIILASHDTSSSAATPLKRS
jgi:hypothetical protein